MLTAESHCNEMIYKSNNNTRKYTYTSWNQAKVALYSYTEISVMDGNHSVKLKILCTILPKTYTHTHNRDTFHDPKFKIITHIQQSVCVCVFGCIYICLRRTANVQLTFSIYLTIYMLELCVSVDENGAEELINYE